MTSMPTALSAKMKSAWLRRGRLQSLAIGIHQNIKPPPKPPRPLNRSPTSFQAIQRLLQLMRRLLLLREPGPTILSCIINRSFPPSVSQVRVSSGRCLPILWWPRSSLRVVRKPPRSSQVISISYPFIFGPFPNRYRSLRPILSGSRVVRTQQSTVLNLHRRIKPQDNEALSIGHQV